jgi:hypothetical protein
MLNVRPLILAVPAALLAGVASAQDTGDTGGDTGIVVPVNPGKIVLVDRLDEQEGDFYCADMQGSTSEAGDRVQAHTCKDQPRAEDQVFYVNYPETGQISLRYSDLELCVETRGIVDGSELHVQTCDSTIRKQKWVSDEFGMIHPASNMDLCWAVQDTPRGRPGSPDGLNYKRYMWLETCADYDIKYVAWTIPGGSVGL